LNMPGMEIDKERLKRLFPHLAEEVLQGRCKIRIDSYRTDPVTAERAVMRRFAGYNPTVIDFIRRCDTVEQAEEIIDFMERRGEISEEYAGRLREKIRREGVRSLGPKKNPGYYEETDPIT